MARRVSRSGESEGAPAAPGAGSEDGGDGVSVVASTSAVGAQDEPQMANLKWVQRCAVCVCVHDARTLRLTPYPRAPETASIA